jgi:hypothetical protein
VCVPRRETEVDSPFLPFGWRRWVGPDIGEEEGSRQLTFFFFPAPPFLNRCHTHLGAFRVGEARIKNELFREGAHSSRLDESNFHSAACDVNALLNFSNSLIPSSIGLCELVRSVS